MFERFDTFAMGVIALLIAYGIVAIALAGWWLCVQALRDLHEELSLTRHALDEEIDYREGLSLLCDAQAGTWFEMNDEIEKLRQERDEMRFSRMMQEPQETKPCACAEEVAPIKQSTPQL